jgi:hypothetical protein
VILGSDQQRLHEEVITAGGVLKEGRFSRIGVMQLQAALGAIAAGDVPEAMQQRIGRSVGQVRRSADAGIGGAKE